jgi:acyl carrier protein
MSGMLSIIIIYLFIVIFKINRIMQTENIKEQVTSYILESTYAEKEKIKSETLIFKEGFFDSMGFVMLLGFLEENFGIKASDSDLVEENFESINAIVNYVETRQAA